MDDVRWIDLEGADNVRDVGGLPTEDGHRIRAGVLLRSDSTREMTPADVRVLVDGVGVRTVVDLRTEVELHNEGPDLVDAEPALTVHQLSLFPTPSQDPTRGDTSAEAPVVLPWEQRDDGYGTEATDGSMRGTSGVYLRYLYDRADSILESLRLIAHRDGATLVHCAAGKDRTGTVVAFALREVGATREAVVADYVRSAERIDAVFARLAGRRTYAANLVDSQAGEHAPRASTMHRLLDAVDERFGGVPAWLRANGWTERDAAALRQRLVD